MRLNSLAFRLFASAAAWTLVVLPVTAVILISLYRDTVERNFDARLNLYLTNLVADVAAAGPERLSQAPDLGEPLFNLPFSGWYWQITPLGAGSVPLQTSNSLLDQRLTLPSAEGVAANTKAVRRAYVNGPEDQRLRVIEREITLNSETGETVFSFAVAGDSSEMNETVTEFTRLLIAALAILGSGLVVATFFQVRFGLRPLRQVRQGLAAIRSGEAEKLEGDLPSEIEPLQAELNALIQSNREVVERARMHVGNLAHALKTPLSVITNEARGKRGAFADKVQHQAEVMRDQITHHLDRARMAARSGVIGSVTAVRPVLDPLVGALRRIYDERNVTISMACPDKAGFAGEKQDFEEMVGNLLDNACKWAESEVRVAVTRGKGGRYLIVHVDDDGPGLSKSQREAAIRRGRRLDESKPGSGLGLSIVADLAHLYKGRLSLRDSPKGGLRARLELPAG